MKPELKECSLIFSHQDQVMLLPKEAELLASDSFCPNQMYSVGENIFCLQGHPEFTRDFAKERLDTRFKLIGEEKYAAAVASLKQKTDSAEVGNWIRNFFSSKA
jgi:GMP synthase-like glutamine amidotransferase